jgi:hypothetical protein
MEKSGKIEIFQKIQEISSDPHRPMADTLIFGRPPCGRNHNRTLTYGKNVKCRKNVTLGIGGGTYI